MTELTRDKLFALIDVEMRRWMKCDDEIFYFDITTATCDAILAAQGAEPTDAVGEPPQLHEILEWAAPWMTNYALSDPSRMVREYANAVAGPLAESIAKRDEQAARADERAKVVGEVAQILERRFQELADTTDDASWQRYCEVKDLKATVRSLAPAGASLD